MKKEQKTQVVDELTARLKAADTLLVADYRGLTMPQIDELRTRLIESGARFTVDKNTLTRRAAEAAGADALLALLEGPTRSRSSTPTATWSRPRRRSPIRPRDEGARDPRRRHAGRAMTADEVESLATLPPADVLRGQVLGAIVAPLSALRRAPQRAAAEPRRAHRRPHRAAREARRHRSAEAAPPRPSEEPRRPRSRAAAEAPEEAPPRRARRGRGVANRCGGPEPAAETEEENA